MSSRRKGEGTFYLASDDSLYGADNWTAANMGIFCRFGFVFPRHCGFSRVDEVLRVN